MRETFAVIRLGGRDVEAVTAVVSKSLREIDFIAIDEEVLIEKSDFFRRVASQKQRCGLDPIDALGFSAGALDRVLAMQPEHAGERRRDRRESPGARLLDTVGVHQRATCGGGCGIGFKRGDQRFGRARSQLGVFVEQHRVAPARLTQQLRIVRRFASTFCELDQANAFTRRELRRSIIRRIVEHKRLELNARRRRRLDGIQAPLQQLSAVRIHDAIAQIHASQRIRRAAPR